MNIFGYEFKIHKANHYNCEWYNYIRPRRLTLKGGAPVYKWLWWAVANPEKVKEYDYFERLKIRKREEEFKNKYRHLNR